jgi:hypothetical protein
MPKTDKNEYYCGDGRRDGAHIGLKKRNIL